VLTGALAETIYAADTGTARPVALGTLRRDENEVLRLLKPHATSSRPRLEPGIRAAL